MFERSIQGVANIKLAYKSINLVEIRDGFGYPISPSPIRFRFIYVQSK